MNRSLSALVLTFLLLLAACTSGDRQQRLAQLEELERQNVADSLMTNDSLAQALADFFDRHGSPNERLRAHYILGRTYADLGEAPAAINAYLDASTCADTTAQDCDWAKLSRVYGQMADVFYKQNLMEDYLSSCDKSISYAWKAKDTIQAVRESTMKSLGFYKMELYDSVVAIFERLNSDCYRPHKQIIATNGIILVASYLKTGQMEKAKQYIDTYEAESGFFDSQNIIKRGKEAFYYFKGDYYLRTKQIDSAEFLFRLQLSKGHDAINQNMAAQGLTRLYQLEDKLDSAFKYLQYSYIMNDSIYKMMATEAVENVSGLYNYNRHQQQAKKEHEHAIQLNKSKSRITVALLILLAIFILFFSVWRFRRREMETKIQNAAYELTLSMKELELLQAQKLLLEKQIQEEKEAVSRYKDETDYLRKENNLQMKRKESELYELKRQIVMLEERISSYSEHANYLNNYQASDILAEKSLDNSPVYRKLKRKADAPKKLQVGEWKELEEMVEDILPGFYNFLYAHKGLLTEKEYKICILFRLHIRMKQTAGFIEVAKSQVSTISTGILQKLFKEEGSGRELKKRLESIF